MPISAKNCDIFTNFFLNFADRTEKSGSAVLAEPDRGLYLVFQVVHIGRLRSDESIERELSAEAKAGDEAVEGGFAVDGCPGVDVLDEPLFLLADDFISEEILAIGKNLHIALDLFILL